MEARTYLEVIRGVERINRLTGKALYSDSDKAQLVSEAGCDELLGQIEVRVQSIRRVMRDSRAMDADGLYSDVR